MKKTCVIFMMFLSFIDGDTENFFDTQYGRKKRKQNIDTMFFEKNIRMRFKKRVLV